VSQFVEGRSLKSSSSAIDSSYLSTSRSGRSLVLSSLGFLVNGLLSVFDIVTQGVVYKSVFVSFLVNVSAFGFVLVALT